MPLLYLVPTPIGNLEDITLRALRVLKEVAVIAAANVERSRLLLEAYELDTPMLSYLEPAGLEALWHTLNRDDAALISDGGTPAFDDSALPIIQEALERGIPIVPLPGPNAAITALVASGLPTDGFVFIGTLPKNQLARRNIIKRVSHERKTVILYENPYRLTDTLQLIMTDCGDERPVCVAEEISKQYEFFYRGTARGAFDYFRTQNPRGDVTVLLGGHLEVSGPWERERVLEALLARLEAGESLSQAAKAIASESKWKKSDVYALGVDVELEE